MQVTFIGKLYGEVITSVHIEAKKTLKTRKYFKIQQPKNNIAKDILALGHQNMSENSDASGGKLSNSATLLSCC